MHSKDDSDKTGALLGVNEENFQQILRGLEDGFRNEAGVVRLNSIELLGISTEQIERLIIHCAEYQSIAFYFDNGTFVPQVLVCILQVLADYSVPKGIICKLDLSGNNLSHPDVEKALHYFLEHTKIQWDLALDNCQLDLNSKFAEPFACSKNVNKLSIQDNKEQGNPQPQQDNTNPQRILDKSFSIVFV